MLQCETILGAEQCVAVSAVTDTVVLDYDTRKKSRFKTQTLSGQEIGVILPRGTVLADGNQLGTIDGGVVLVRAQLETVSEVRSDNSLLLMRAAYHLGNRHMPLQLGEGLLRYQHDHVLDDMVIGLGLTVSTERSQFHPEDGAYGAHKSSHHHHEH